MHRTSAWPSVDRTVVVETDPSCSVCEIDSRDPSKALSVTRENGIRLDTAEHERKRD